MKKFKGSVTQISCSPHGRTEGLFIDGQVFIKIPPHTLMSHAKVAIGDEVTGDGDMKTSKLGKTVRHAKVYVNGDLFADDQIDEKQDEKMKKRHKKSNEALKLAKEKSMSSQGLVVAVASKKHGAVDRVLVDGGISVHVPKDLELHEKDLRIGDYLIVEGPGRTFGDHSFLRAEFIMNGEGEILSL